MLVLKLRRGDKARLGPDIVVTCVRTLEGALVLAIDAPRELRITREPRVDYHAPQPLDEDGAKPAA